MRIDNARTESSQAHASHEHLDESASSDANAQLPEPAKAPHAGHESAPPKPWRGLNDALLHDAAKLQTDVHLEAGLDLTGRAKDSRVDDIRDPSLSWIADRPLDPQIAAALNLIDAAIGKSHVTVRSQLAKQFNETLDMLGLSGRNGAPPPQQESGVGATKETTAGGDKRSSGAKETSQGSDKVFPGSPMDISQYASGDGGVDVGAIIKFTVPPAPVESKGGATPKDSRIQWIQDAMNKPLGGGGAVETTPGELVGGAAKGVAAGVAGPPKGETPAGSPASAAKPENAGEKAAAEAKAKAQKEQAEKERAEKEKQEQLKKEQEKNKAADPEKKDDKKEEKKYVDPDQALQPAMRTPEEIEMQLNGRKRPVNPDVGDSGHIDGATVPRKVEGVDPTVAYIDNLIGGGGTSGLSNRVTTAPIDYAQGRGPGTLDGPAPSGGATPEADHD
jgi:hypothetical protein